MAILGLLACLGCIKLLRAIGRRQGRGFGIKIANMGARLSTLNEFLQSAAVYSALADFHLGRAVGAGPLRRRGLRGVPLAQYRRRGGPAPDGEIGLVVSLLPLG